jgi:hypothetical protein
MGINPSNGDNSPGTARPEAGASRKPGVLSSLSGRLLLAGCILQFALLVKLGWGFWRPEKPLLPALSHPATRDNDVEPTFRANPGPWGELEYVRINLEPPDEFLPVEDGVFERARWFFEGHTRAQLTNLFAQCDLSPPQRAALLNPAAWSEETNGITVVPGDEIVLGLSRQARTQIYSVLGESTRNNLQCWPFRFRRGNIDDWFAPGEFSEATLKLLKSLVYERGATLCFSDVMEASAKIPDASERRQLLKALSGSPSLLMKLHVRPDSDVSALTAYWGRGFRTKDLETLFRSLTRVRGGVSIDVAQLLPPLARKKLNTYPVPADDPSSNQPPNCSWTAMNFFKDPPEERFHNPEVWMKELETSYVPVTEPTFGDLLFLMKPDGALVHVAVFIADDVVFTKNGESDAKPWLLMKWEDVMASYSTDHPMRLLMFRSKEMAK